VDVRRQVLDEVRHPACDVSALDQVVVVEDQHDVRRHAGKVVQQRRQNRVGGAIGRPEEGACASADPGGRSVERRDQVRPENGGIVVAAVQRDPRHGPVDVRLGRELGEERRLAETRRSGDHRQPRRRAATQALLEPRPRHDAALRPGCIQLGLEQRADHDGNGDGRTPSVADVSGGQRRDEAAVQHPEQDQRREHRG
jgi:hypothetical protein